MKRILSFLASVVIALVLTGCASSPRPNDAADPPKEGNSHYAKFGTNRIHYVVQGKGKHTVVLVHCWAGNLGFWNEQLPALTNKARVVLIDLPGHGQSDKPHTAYTMDFFAAAVLAVMHDAHVDKATLIGHSMGVPVICRVYHQAPERVAALVSVDGTLRRPKITPEQAERIVGPLRSADYREQSRQFLATMFPVPGTEAIRDRVISEMLETPQYVMLGAMDGMFGPDQPDWDPGHVNVPVLVINAPNPMWTDDYKQYVHSLSPLTDYYAIQNTGHWCMLEKPAEFNADLVDGLNKFDLIDR
jgi:pimeloyl-ACP methyl ester carboxylesterase